MPVLGIKQGDFEPVIVLVTHKKQQLFNLGADYAIGKNTLLKTEVAMSNNDVNTFSKINNGDDQGWDAKFQLNNTKQLAAKNNLHLNTSLDYEYVQDKFKPLERLRTVEFSRDWGLPVLFQPATENIIRLGTGLADNKNNSLTYGFTQYHRSDSYNGFQNTLTQVSGWNGWQFNNNLTI